MILCDEKLSLSKENYYLGYNFGDMDDSSLLWSSALWHLDKCS